MRFLVCVRVYARASTGEGTHGQTLVCWRKSTVGTARNSRLQEVLVHGVDGHALTSAFFLPLLLRQTAPREQWQKGTAVCHPGFTGMYAPPADATWHNQRATQDRIGIFSRPDAACAAKIF